MTTQPTSLPPVLVTCRLGADDLKQRFAEIGALAGQLLDRFDRRFAHAVVLQLRQRIAVFVGHVAVEELVDAFVAGHVFQETS
jgi:hypothetical protein